MIKLRMGRLSYTLGDFYSKSLESSLEVLYDHRIVLDMKRHLVMISLTVL